VPAESVTGAWTGAVTNVANEPVFGTGTTPFSWPSTRRTNVRPLLGLATRTVIRYEPAWVTFTV